ncbi:hypothetical protein FS749_013290, partial [Ceratobasidium sp. UAMH 11750]
MDFVGELLPGLGPVFLVAQDINQRCQNVKVHRLQCAQLARRCIGLVYVLRNEQHIIEHPRLSEALDELEGVLLKVRRRVVEWANLSRLASLMRQGQIMTDISALNNTLDAYVMRFQLISVSELNEQQPRVDPLRREDQEDIRRMLQALVRSPEDLQTAARMRGDVPTLMRAIQEELANQQPGTNEHSALREGLNTLHIRTGIFPSLSNLDGQISNLMEHSGAEGGATDVYEGQWLGDQRVMLRVIRLIEGESSAERLCQEMNVWRQLQHTHVSRFYGTCYVGQRLFSVVPWADGGNLLTYIQSHPDCDRMKFLREIALGLVYLHGFDPMVVHGDLRA